MTGEPAAAKLQGLTERVKNLLQALDRQDRLETAGEFAGWLGRQDAERLTGAAREIFLRALARVSDPINYRILRRLDPGRGPRGPRRGRELALGRRGELRPEDPAS